MQISVNEWINERNPANFLRLPFSTASCTSRWFSLQKSDENPQKPLFFASLHQMSAKIGYGNGIRGEKQLINISFLHGLTLSDSPTNWCKHIEFHWTDLYDLMNNKRRNRVRITIGLKRKSFETRARAFRFTFNNFLAINARSMVHRIDDDWCSLETLLDSAWYLHTSNADTFVFV